MTSKWAILITNSTDAKYSSWYKPGAVGRQPLSDAFLFDSQDEARSVALLLSRLEYTHIEYTPTRVYSGFALMGRDQTITSALCSTEIAVREWISEHYRITQSKVLDDLPIKRVVVEASKWLDISQRLSTQVLEDQLLLQVE